MKFLYAFWRWKETHRGGAMLKLSNCKGICLGLMLAGIGLMSVAMFLHPMSPEDFLAAVLSDPLQTVADAEGSAAALVFWASVMVFLAGAGRLAASLFAALRRQGADFMSRYRALAH